MSGRMMESIKPCLKLCTTITSSGHATYQVSMYGRSDISTWRATHRPTKFTDCIPFRQGHKLCSVPRTILARDAARQSNPKCELNSPRQSSSQSFLSRLEKYADEQKKHAEATELPTTPVCGNAAEDIPKSSRMGFPSEESPPHPTVDLNLCASSSEDAPPSTEERPRNLAKMIDEVATFLAPREHGDIRDVTLVCLSFAVLVYISQRLVCAYCVVSGTFNRH